MSEIVAILGASTNPRRYSHQAQQSLLENGHVPLPVNPKYDQIDGVRCYPDLQSIKLDIDTITVYVRADILITMADDLVQARPKRVIFNPGAESATVAARLESEGIRVQNACTLILLNTSSFSG